MILCICSNLNYKTKNIFSGTLHLSQTDWKSVTSNDYFRCVWHIRISFHSILTHNNCMNINNGNIATLLLTVWYYLLHMCMQDRRLYTLTLKNLFNIIWQESLSDRKVMMPKVKATVLTLFYYGFRCYLCFRHPDSVIWYKRATQCHDF